MQMTWDNHYQSFKTRNNHNEVPDARWPLKKFQTRDIHLMFLTRDNNWQFSWFGTTTDIFQK